MSTFASSFLSGATSEINTLKTEVQDKLPARYYFAQGNTSASTTSSSYVSRLSQTVTITADEVAQFITTCSLSADTLNLVVATEHLINSFAQNCVSYWMAPVANSSGTQNTVSNQSMRADSAGTYAFDLVWKIHTGGPGTIYSVSAQSLVLIWKRRA